MTGSHHSELHRLNTGVAVLGLALIVAGCSPDADVGEVRYGARFDSLAPRRVVAGPARCEGCSIRFEQVVTLGTLTDAASIAPGAASVPCSIGRLSTGESVMSRIVGGGEIVVYNAEGEPTRTIGRSGKGPGEFGRDLRVIVGQGDTLHVVDNGNLRLTTITPDGQVVASFRLPAVAHSHALLDDGAVLLHGRPSGRPGDERPLFERLDLATGEVRGFGTFTTEFMADLDQWVLAPARGAGFWAGSIWDYEVYRWSAPDSLDHTLIRESDRFRDPPDLSPQAFERMHVEEPPPPIVSAIYHADDGLLWIYLLVPDRNWSPAAPESRSLDWMRGTFDTVIEVIDPRNGEAIVESRVDDVMSPMCGQPLVYRVVESEGGDTRAQLLRPRIER